MAPLVAITTVVPTPTSTVCGPPSHHPIPSRSAVTTEFHLAWKVVPSARIEALETRKNRMYDHSWLRFTHWATGEGIDPHECSQSCSSSSHFSVSALRYLRSIASNEQGYRTCIASALRHKGKAAASQGRTVSGLIASMELQGLELCRPYHNGTCALC